MSALRMGTGRRLDRLVLRLFACYTTATVKLIDRFSQKNRMTSFVWNFELVFLIITAATDNFGRSPKSKFTDCYCQD